MERFSIQVPDSVLEDLRERLQRTRFPDQLQGAGWQYGTELGYLKELISYWRDQFDWRAQERALNRFDQYKANVRLYFETQHTGNSFLKGGRIEVPTAAAIFKRELYKAPRAWAEAGYNLKRYTVFPRGGHFAALEEPELLVHDLREFFRELR